VTPASPARRLLLAVLLAAVAIDAVLLGRWLLVRRETASLRDAMSDAQRRVVDLAAATDETRARTLVRRARLAASRDTALHLAVSVDSGVMVLVRNGTVLRRMRVEVGEGRRIGVAPDTVYLAAARRGRRIERVLGADEPWEVPRWVFTARGLAVPEDRHVKGALGPGAVVLSGGTVLYATPRSGPLADSTWILPGAVRMRAEDLRAIWPNLAPGQPVYFYE
jgi:hypothetical protein